MTTFGVAKSTVLSNWPTLLPQVEHERCLWYKCFWWFCVFIQKPSRLVLHQNIHVHTTYDNVARCRYKMVSQRHNLKFWYWTGFDLPSRRVSCSTWIISMEAQWKTVQKVPLQHHDTWWPFLKTWGKSLVQLKFLLKFSLLVSSFGQNNFPLFIVCNWIDKYVVCCCCCLFVVGFFVTIQSYRNHGHRSSITCWRTVRVCSRKRV